MDSMTDTTHDATLESWVEEANAPGTDFPIQNLPLGVFEAGGGRRIGAAIGDRVVDLASCSEAGLLDALEGAIAEACRGASLNALMAQGNDASRALRRRLVAILTRGSAEAERASKCLVEQSSARMVVPAEIGDYTDFYASIHHATNVGSMFRPDNPLLPNYKWVPIGYHGRASSIVVSGTPVKRPEGQTREGEAAPQFGPSQRLDYEMEVGFYVGRGNAHGEPIPIDRAGEAIFGFCLVNDWSARDIQAWEYQPLGPFLAKSFATTVSPWVITADALAPFRTAAFAREAGDPEPLAYLSSESDQKGGGLDLTLEVSIATARMREERIEPHVVSRGSFASMYWTVAQLLTHHASNGCNLRPGDLLASGTVSGATRDSRGSMLEAAWRGSEPLELASGEKRAFLADGDEVIMRGWCERERFRRIGFGECRGVVG
jgi:fumarylacetoacetase